MRLWLASGSSPRQRSPRVRRNAPEGLRGRLGPAGPRRAGLRRPLRPPGPASSRRPPAEAEGAALRRSPPSGRRPRPPEQPETKRAWLGAARRRCSRSERSAFYPWVELDASFSGRSRRPRRHERLLPDGLRPTAILNWLLFDFGGRSADIDEAKLALNEDALPPRCDLNNVILQVLQAYYGYEGAKPQGSAGASVKRPRRTSGGRRAASRRRRDDRRRPAGPDGRFAAAPRLPNLDGQIAVIAAPSRPPSDPGNTPVEAGELPEDLDVDRVTQTVDDLIAQATPAARPRRGKDPRPRAKSRVSSVRSNALPTLGGVATYGRTTTAALVPPPRRRLLRRRPPPDPGLSGFQKSTTSVGRGGSRDRGGECRWIRAAGHPGGLVELLRDETAGQKIRTPATSSPARRRAPP